ncbi:TetR/AcrR family transcriptional regulator [Clostridium neuense]|uniref:TetR/AcrR family transcriptional regulator n=1 Tax=Clostridium neuense TaxID=1728934 RepID=A0ABW8TAZ8_9CLOT
MRKKDDKKQESIKKAVIKLILEEGFHGTSISKIAKEAEVSPATVYIYYENKDIMFHKIYLEYSEEILNHLLSKVSEHMTGQELIETLIKAYYNYIIDNKEIFLFVEQFSSCPALISSCKERKGIKKFDALLENMKKDKIIKNYSNNTIISLIFSPVKSICMNHCITNEEKLVLLKELIQIMQKALAI